MADPNNIQQILAALAGQSSSSNTPVQSQQPPGVAQPPPSMPPQYLAHYQSPQPAAAGGFALPQPKSSGAVDLSSIRPSNSGSLSLGGSGVQDAMSKARGMVGSKGMGYESGRDSRGRGDSYRRSRSRSPDRFREGGYGYGYDRRDERRHGRDRSNSPRRDSNTGGVGGEDQGHEVLGIESNLVGLIIGQQGKNLRKVEQETNARVQFLTGPESSGPTRQCKISGTFQAREDAKAEIRRIISENGNPIRGSLAIDNREKARVQSQQKNAQSTRPEDALQIMVPNRTVGLIIGRGGETIKDLQERSGCHVNILGEDHSVNGLRPVNLIGPAHSQQEAKNLIMEVVESDNKNMATGVGGGRGGNVVTNQPMPGQGGDPNKVEDTLYVPSDAVGMIIGKGGETIKEMQNQSGCKINVSQPSGRDVQREIGLVGTRQAIEAAKSLLMEKVNAVEEKNRSRRGEQSGFDPYSQNQQQQGGQSGAQQSYGSYGQATQGYQQQQNPNASQQTGEDPYAAYGGYANYVKMWYAAAAAQQQGQGQAQGGQQTGGGMPPQS